MIRIRSAPSHETRLANNCPFARNARPIFNFGVRDDERIGKLRHFSNLSHRNSVFGTSEIHFCTLSEIVSLQLIFARYMFRFGIKINRNCILLFLLSVFKDTLQITEAGA